VLLGHSLSNRFGQRVQALPEAIARPTLARVIQAERGVVSRGGFYGWRVVV
jgi:hypothetical protein